MAAPNMANLGPQSLRAITQPIVLRRGSGGVQTTDGIHSISGSFGKLYDRFDPSAAWYTLETQRKNFLNIPFQRLLRYAIDLSPALGKALYDFQRYCNPGRRTENDASDAARDATEMFQDQIGVYHSSFSSHCDTIFSSIFTVGAAFMELALSKDTRYPVDIVVRDPMTAIFIEKDFGERGAGPALHQRQGLGRPKDLSELPLVKYIPFDNLVGDPYGRPLIGGGVYSSMILLGIIRDAQRAIANAGLSRMDYELDAEQLLALIDRNPDIAGDDEATAQFINDQIQLVRNVLTNLDIDEDYVHLSTVKVNYATNPMQTNMAGVVDTLKTIQRDIATGAKSYSVLLNINDSTADTYAIRQMEVFRCQYQ